MAYDSRIIANKFIKLYLESNNRHISRGELVRLVYSAHGWHLAMTGKPLINDKIRCGKDSVFIKRLYKFFDYGTIREYITNYKGEVYKDDTNKYNFTDKFINALFEYYSSKNYFFLKRTINVKGSPLLNYKAYNDVITDDEIREFFKMKLDNRTMGQEVLDWYIKYFVYAKAVEHDIIKII